MIYDKDKDKLYIENNDNEWISISDIIDRIEKLERNKEWRDELIKMGMFGLGWLIGFLVIK